MNTAVPRGGGGGARGYVSCVCVEFRITKQNTVQGPNPTPTEEKCKPVPPYRDVGLPAAKEAVQCARPSTTRRRMGERTRKEKKMKSIAGGGDPAESVPKKAQEGLSRSAAKGERPKQKKRNGPKRNPTPYNKTEEGIPMKRRLHR